jgi:hypothetical protein
VYLLTTYVYIGVPLLFCLSALYGILRSVFSGVDDTAGPTGKDALARFQLGKIIFASWEYSITFPTSIAMNQVRDELCTRRGFLTTKMHFGVCVATTWLRLMSATIRVGLCFLFGCVRL